MQVVKTFPGWDAARWSRPWFAKVGTWPDSGPAVMTFGKTAKGVIPPACTVEADAGDVVRWGMKDLATGQADPTQSGWGVVRPGGGIDPCTQDEARVYRRRAHPEDANAAAIRPAGFAKGKGRPRAPAPAPAPAVPDTAAADIVALIVSAKLVCAAWKGWQPRADAGRDPEGWRALVDAITGLEGIVGAGFASPAAPAVQSAQPAAPTAPVEAEEAEADESPAPVTARAVDVDENGLPLF